MSDVGGRIGRMILLGLLSLATLGFGAMSLCGGYWTAVAVPAFFAPSGGGAVMVLIISVPSLVGGFFMTRLCWRALRGLDGEPKAGDESR